VRAHARSDAKAELVERLGAVPVRGNAEGDDLLRWLPGTDAVVDLRISIPSTSRAVLPGSWREYQRLRGPVAGQLVDAAITAGVPRVVHDTVTMIYADGGDDVLTEDSPVDAPGHLHANVVTEQHLMRFTAAGGTGVALRFGQFYGPDDAYSLDLYRRARRGQALVVGQGQGWSSAIHTDDVGPAVAAALSVPAGVYNVVDDEPLRRSDLVAVLASAVGREKLRTPPSFLTSLAPAPVRALARSQRVSAERFRQVTGWRPSVPSRRSGLPQAASRSSDDH
jgi:nucleoside-diphosphate-sugar epimerase